MVQQGGWSDIWLTGLVWPINKTLLCNGLIWMKTVCTLVTISLFTETGGSELSISRRTDSTANCVLLFTTRYHVSWQVVTHNEISIWRTKSWLCNSSYVMSHIGDRDSKSLNVLRRLRVFKHHALLWFQPESLWLSVPLYWNSRNCFLRVIFSFPVFLKFPITPWNRFKVRQNLSLVQEQSVTEIGFVIKSILRTNKYFPCRIEPLICYQGGRLTTEILSGPDPWMISKAIYCYLCYV